MIQELSVECRVKALLLDLDGTLANSLPMLYHYYSKFLEQYGYRGTPEEFERLNGPSMLEIMSILQKRYSLPSEGKDLFVTYQAMLVQAYAQKVPLFQGGREFLLNAREQGLLLAVVSSAHPRYRRGIPQGSLDCRLLCHYYHLRRSPSQQTSPGDLPKSPSEA